MIESVSNSNLGIYSFTNNNTSSLNNSNTVVENIKCCVRCRPLNAKELELGAGCIKINEEHNSIYVENKTDTKNFENKPYIMDSVFTDSIKQEEIYNKVAFPVLKGFIQGFNCTIFAYGQTGAGKTHTMLGPLEAIYESKSLNHGIIPRILQYIFSEDQTEIKKILKSETESIEEINNLKIEIKCSCLEIYQEQIIDLLTSNVSDDSNKLTIREDIKRGMFIDGLSEFSVNSDKAAKELIMLGLKNRHVAATNMNAESSRSHLIFTIFMNLSYSEDDDIVVSRSSRLHLIDLAGSERQKATQSIGERIKEAGMINKSLSTLGNVINALVETSEGKSKHVPFRDSKLTYFLKDSLGGNAKTTIIANISQSIIQLQETISTLKFVQRAKMIKNKACVNENVTDTVKILQNEIKRLKEVIAKTGKHNIMPNIENYKCQFCSKIKQLNEESEEDNHRSMNSKMNSLMIKVGELLNYESELSNKLNLIDTVAISSIEKFFINKEIHETDYKILIGSLEKKTKQFNNVISFKESILNQISTEVNKFQSDNIINNLFIEKINIFIEELIQFKLDFEVNHMLSLTKLNEENKLLKIELQSMKYLKEYYLSIKENKTKKKNLEKNMFDKENVDKIGPIIREFIDTSKEVKSFFQQNFNSGNEILNKEDSYALILRKELDLLKLQLEEFKISEENNLKIIDDLQSENFLLNMEVAKFKSTNINDNDGKSVDSCEEKNEHENLQINLLNLEYCSGSKRDSKERSKSPKTKTLEYAEKFFTPKNNQVPFDVVSEEQNLDEKNSFLNNLRNSILKKSPSRRMLRSSLLYSTKQPVTNGPIFDTNTVYSKDKSTIFLSRENIEFIKLKEKLDDAVINLEERTSEVSNKNIKIEELNYIINDLQLEKEKYESKMKELQEEIDTLNEANGVLSCDIISLNEKFRMANLHLNNENDKKNFENIQEKFQQNFRGDAHKNNDNYKTVLTNIEEFSQSQFNKYDLFNQIVAEKLEYNEIVLDRLNNSLKLFFRDNQTLKKDIKKHKESIEKCHKKIKLLFGNIDIDAFLNQENNDDNNLIKMLNFDKLKLTKLEKKIFELKEEKKQLQNDIALLHMDFSKGLSEFSMNNKIQLLMKVKEENYKLKKYSSEMKKKNDILEKNLLRLQETMNNILSDQNGTNYTSMNSGYSQYDNTNNVNFFNFEEVIRIRLEHKELIERVLELDIKQIVREEKSNFKQSIEILKFIKEMDLLNKTDAKINNKYNTITLKTPKKKSTAFFELNDSMDLEFKSSNIIENNSNNNSKHSTNKINNSISPTNLKNGFLDKSDFDLKSVKLLTSPNDQNKFGHSRYDIGGNSSELQNKTISNNNLNSNITMKNKIETNALTPMKKINKSTSLKIAKNKIDKKATHNSFFNKKK